MSERVNRLTNDELTRLRALLEREEVRAPRSGGGAELSRDEAAVLREQAEALTAAVERASEIASREPRSAPALLESAKLWEFTNMHGRAIDLYQRAIRLDPNSHEATARLAISLIRAGRAEEGLRVASDLASREPEFRFKTIKRALTITSWTVLADALRVNGDIDGAIRAYERALELEPEDAHSAARLAELYLVQNRVEDAADLEPRVDATFNSELKSTLRLAANDASMLPAITQIRLNAAINAPVA